MVEFFIASLCLNLNPTYSQYTSACTNALTATSIQTGIKQNIDNLKEHYEKEIQKETGNAIWVMGMTLYQFKSKQMTISTNFKPIADHLQLNLSTDTQNLTLTWTF